MSDAPPRRSGPEAIPPAARSPEPGVVAADHPAVAAVNRAPAAGGDALPLLPEQRRLAAPLAPRRLWRSFGAAFLGLGHLLRHEPNAQIHAALAVVATALGLWLGLTPPEWALLMALFGLVIGLEAMNTAVEGLADLAMPHRDPRVATIKDVAAGGVLVAALAAAAAGIFLFGPRLLRILGG